MSAPTHPPNNRPQVRPDHTCGTPSIVGTFSPRRMSHASEKSAGGWPSVSNGSAASHPMADHDPQLFRRDFGPDDGHHDDDNGDDDHHTNTELQILDSTVPRAAIYGNTSRFGMVKGSIAARKATAAAMRAYGKGGGGAPHHNPRQPEAHGTNPASMLPASVVVTTAGLSEDENERGSSIGLGMVSPSSVQGAFGREEGRPESAGVGRETDLLGPMGSFKELPKVNQSVGSVHKQRCSL